MKEIKTECICKDCLNAIYSRGERLRAATHHWKDEDEDETIRCWWCDEEIEDEYYEIIF